MSGGLRRRRDLERRQHGGVLVEFSVSVIALWLIVAATLDLGRAFAASHVLQSAARAAARQLALDDDIRWDAPFGEAVRRIFDPAYLVVDADCLEDQVAAATEVTTPEAELVRILRQEGLTLNLLLRPLMVFEHVTVGGREWHLLRYPGALLGGDPMDPDKPCVTPYTVGIAEVDDRQSRIRLHPVVEEIQDGAFSLAGETSGDLRAGTVALRLLYPFQAAGLSSWRVVDGVSKPVGVDEASDYEVDLSPVRGSRLEGLDARGPDGAPQAYARLGQGNPIPVYGGSLGLGIQGVLGREVRPFRRVLMAQAIAPREVIGGGSEVIGGGS